MVMLPGTGDFEPEDDYCELCGLAVEDCECEVCEHCGFTICQCETCDECGCTPCECDEAEDGGV